MKLVAIMVYLYEFCRHIVQKAPIYAYFGKVCHLPTKFFLPCSLVLSFYSKECFCGSPV